MNGQSDSHVLPLTAKIARLVQERGWNQEDFARIANLNRQTVAQIMDPKKPRKLRNTTVSACARALGLSVLDLRTLPLEPLLQRVANGPALPADDDNLRRLYERSTQPELLSWLERNPDRARKLTPAEIDELLSLQGTGGPLTGFGVERFVELIERKHRLIHQVHAVAGTEYLDVLEKIVGLMFEKIQPYSSRQ
jgi:transcriptional regulator with XRE-family HTH domain